MKNLFNVAALAAVLVASATYASADTLTLGSSATAAGFGNTPVVFAGPSTPGEVPGSPTVPGGTTATFNVSANSPWTPPGMGSSYVSFEAGTGCCGGVVAPNGWYAYYSTFNLTNAAGDTGSISVLADDTTDVYLNGVLIQSAAGGANVTCQVAQPNCLIPTLVTLTGLINGTNVLEFGVHQSNLSATGLDFYGNITGITPEPSSLLLLGTGLIGSAGALFRRRRA